MRQMAALQQQEQQQLLQLDEALRMLASRTTTYLLANVCGQNHYVQPNKKIKEKKEKNDMLREMKMKLLVSAFIVFILHCAVAEEVGEPKTFRGRIDGRRGSDQKYVVPGNG